MDATRDSTLADPQQRIADLERRLAERTAERDAGLAREAAVAAERDAGLAREAATAEVLGVINSSPGDLKPVFDAMLENALRLCGAAYGNLLSYDGECFQVLATTHDLAGHRFKAPPDSALDPILKGENVVTIDDLENSAAYRFGLPHFRRVVEAGGYRSLLNVALRKNGALLGVIAVFDTQVRPFTDKQIALLQNFAAQAVIAMENARLITETREALEQQTATAEVLGVINSSPGDLAPVFDAMLVRAIRLCEATHGHFFNYDGECFHLAAVNDDARYVEWVRQRGAIRPLNNAPLGRVKGGERIVHAVDMQEEEVYRTVPTFREQIDLRGVRSQITLGLFKDNTLLGAMVLYRQVVRPFTDKQIALLENFAAQAVIAMDNARLLTETREALEQQTATAEVLA
jgi:GAF domain-containing protein